ncbi:MULTISPECIES: futalosine hydrolase [Brevibacillus]|uniref:futalosine hydrolase n=1 Tax=Brevibacillus TaxID=55080 RepID=UPI00203AAEA3|nr:MULTISPECIES: futalosine hydrolase [Brevibacillus]MCM3079960.1 futalosine hydrolase [Brevibacillus invocatus]MCM3430153.1 futalosine hydrolase [Brevibacillus invocatus]MDH4616518.1 futalosine hydrolase [Brevibacillus sp. AY1]
MEAQWKERRVLVVTSVEAEREAVWRGLQADSRFEVIIGGVGPMSAAARTARELASQPYDLVVCAGICGGFVGRADVGSIVVASEIICADLGAETPDGYMSVDELGFGSARISVDSDLSGSLTAAVKKAGIPAVCAPVLTLSTVTGTAQTTAELLARVPTAAAEAMEGFGVATAALDFGLPIVELRAVSNAIGPRDKSAWRIKEALSALEQASSALREVLR